MPQTETKARTKKKRVRHLEEVGEGVGQFVLAAAPKTRRADAALQLGAGGLNRGLEPPRLPFS